MWLERHDAMAQFALKEGVISKEQFFECLKIWRSSQGKEIAAILTDKDKKYLTPEQFTKFNAKYKKLSEGEIEALVKNRVRDTYYRLLKLHPSVYSMKVVVLTKDLPRDKVRGTLHLAVPGVEKPHLMAIEFEPKPKIQFDPEKMVDIRDEVTGLAYPVELKRQVWNKMKKLDLSDLTDFSFMIKVPPKTPHLDKFGAVGLGLQVKGNPTTIFFYNIATAKLIPSRNTAIRAARFIFP